MNAPHANVCFHLVESLIGKRFALGGCDAVLPRWLHCDQHLKSLPRRSEWLKRNACFYFREDGFPGSYLISEEGGLTCDQGPLVMQCAVY